MSGILRLESLTKGNTLKQGDKTPLKYRLFDADGEKLNIAGKTAVARLMYPDFLRVGYESETLIVSPDNTVTFSIDKVVQPILYYLEITVDGKYIFPSRNDESKLNIDKSSQGSDVAIIEIIGKDVLVRDIKNMVDSEIKPVVDDMIVSNQKVLENEQVVQEVNILSKQLEERQDQVEQFNNQVITEMTDKDVISAPEILGARGNFDTLGERLNDTTTHLVETAMDIEQRGVNIFKFKEHVPNHNVMPDPNDWDWTMAIDEGINYASLHGTALYFPAGDFNYKGNLVLGDRSLQYIKGSGTAKTRLLFDNSEGYAIETKSYYTRSIMIEDLEIRHIDSTKTSNGVKSHFESGSYNWGGGLIMRNVNISNFTGTSLELVEGFNSYFENCKVTGVTTGTKKGTLLKISRVGSFSNVISFNHCVFHYGKIGIQNLGGGVLNFNGCTFESLDLFLNVISSSSLSPTMSFQDSWFELIQRGVINASIDEDTLEPLNPILNKTPMNNIRFINNLSSANNTETFLNEVVEPYYSKNFNLIEGIIRGYEEIPHRHSQIFKNNELNTDPTLRLMTSYFNTDAVAYNPTGSLKRGSFIVAVEATGLNGAKMHAVFVTTNYRTSVQLQGEVRDPDSIGSDYKIRGTWADDLTLTISTYAKGLNNVKVSCTFFEI